MKENIIFLKRSIEMREKRLKRAEDHRSVQMKSFRIEHGEEMEVN